MVSRLATAGATSSFNSGGWRRHGDSGGRPAWNGRPREEIEGPIGGRSLAEPRIAAAQELTLAPIRAGVGQLVQGPGGRASRSSRIADPPITAAIWVSSRP